jgi:hypothetical protein
MSINGIMILSTSEANYREDEANIFVWVKSLAALQVPRLQRAKPLVWPKMHLHRSKLMNYAKTSRHSIHLRFAKNVSAVRPKSQNQYDDNTIQKSPFTKSLPSLALVAVYVLVPVLCLSKTQRCYTSCLKKSKVPELVFVYFDRSQQSIRDPHGPRHELQSWQVTYDQTEPQRSNDGFVPFFIHVISFVYHFLYSSPLFSTFLYYFLLVLNRK